MAEIILVEVIVGAKQPNDGFPEARAAIAKAYELGADSADFYAASAYVSLIADWNFDAAERDLRKALAINPHHGTANRMLAETCMFQCRHDEAAVYVNRAQVDELTAMRNADILAISLSSPAIIRQPSMYAIECLGFILDSSSRHGRGVGPGANGPDRRSDRRL
jgi:tetratricopeptide (TPR) repeat protein